MDLIEIFVIAAGSAAAALAALAWVFHRWMNQRIAKAEGDYKAHRVHVPAVRKSSVSLATQERDVAHKPVDAQDSEVILLLCSLFGDWHDVVRALVATNWRLEKDPGHAIHRYREWVRKLGALSSGFSKEMRSAAAPIARRGLELCEITDKFCAAAFARLDTANATDVRATIAAVRRERQHLRRAIRGNVDNLRSLLVYEFRALRKAEKASATARENSLAD